MRKGDVCGLYSMCVIITLGDGSVVEQNIYPGDTHCHPVFLQEWTRLLTNQWDQVHNKRVVILTRLSLFLQVVHISCCSSDLCNYPETIITKKIWPTSLVVLVVSSVIAGCGIVTFIMYLCSTRCPNYHR